MSIQDLAHHPLHTEGTPSSECTMVEPPQQSSLPTQQTILPKRMVKNPTTGASFLSLVPELRNEVYRYLLTSQDNVIHIRPHSEFFELHTSILYTNRQISQEAAAIFYGENTFTAYLDYYEDFFRVDKAENSNANLGVDSQLGESQTKKSGSMTSSTILTGFIYPHVFSRIRYLVLNVKFSCCSRRFKSEPWDFHPDWVAASLKTAVDALLPVSALRGLSVDVECLDMGKQVPTRAEFRIALEPLRALSGIRDVWIWGSGMGWNELFVAKLIWDMMGSDEGEE